MVPPERFKSELKAEALAEPKGVPQVHNIQPAAKCYTCDADWTLGYPPCQTSRTNPVAAARQNMWPRCYPTHFDPLGLRSTNCPSY